MLLGPSTHFIITVSPRANYVRNVATNLVEANRARVLAEASAAQHHVVCKGDKRSSTIRMKGEIQADGATMLRSRMHNNGA